jgi:hypothetical protein
MNPGGVLYGICSDHWKLDFIRRESEMRALVVVSIGVAIGGCATNSGGYRTTSKVQQQLLKMNAEQVLVDLGKPHQVTELSASKVTWRYSDHPGGLTGGNCSVVVVVENGIVTEANVNSDDRSWVSFPLGSCRNIIGNLRR